MMSDMPDNEEVHYGKLVDGLTTEDFDPGEDGLCAPSLSLWNHGAALDAEGAPQTAEPDAMTGSR